MKLTAPSGSRKPKRPPNKNDESKLLAQIRLAIGCRLDCTFKRLNTGVFKTMDLKRTVRSAPTGTADLEGTQRRQVRAITTRNPGGFNPVTQEYDLVYGQTIIIETKVPKGGTQSQAQKNYQAAVESVGAIYILARSLQDVLDVLGPEPK